MGIATKIKEYFLDVYSEPTKTKSLNGEYGFNGIGFVPVDSIGNYTVLNGNNNAYSKVGIVYMIISKTARRCGEAILEHKQDDDDKTPIKNSPFLKELKKPNPVQSQSEFIAEIASYKLLRGQYYIWIDKVIGRNFYWVIPTSQVQKAGEFYKVLGKYTIPKEQIHHYRDFVPEYMCYDESVSLSPLEVAGINLRIIDYASAANYKTLRGGAVQGVAYEEPIQGEIPATPDQVKELRDLLIKRYNSPETHGEVTIHSHKIGYTPFGLKPAELMILENIMFNEERICDILNYPRILLGDKGGSLGGNIRTEAKKEFILDAVFPVLSTITQSLTTIFELKDSSIAWDRDSFPEMQIDWVSTSQALDRMPYLLYNEKRKIVGHEPRPEFENIILMPANLTTLEELENGGMPPAGDSIDNTGDYGNQ